VGIHDSFFDLGGNSLLAAQVISRLRSAVGLDVPLDHFFAAPTLQGLAVAVVQARAEQVGLSETSRLSDEIEGSSGDDVPGQPAHGKQPA
jgi:hypothetical protein